MLIITITGNVVLCANEDNREEVVFSNVFTTPIMAIWDAPAFREAREALALTQTSFELEPIKKHPQPIVAIYTLKTT